MITSNISFILLQSQPQVRRKVARHKNFIGKNDETIGNRLQSGKA
jgi:hypothetical protein